MSDKTSQHDPTFYQDVWARLSNLTDRDLDALIARLDNMRGPLSKISESELQKVTKALGAASAEKTRRDVAVALDTYLPKSVD